MKYILFAYRDEQQFSTMTVADLEMLRQACSVNNEALRANGHLLAVEHFGDRNTSTTVQFRDGALAINIGSAVPATAQLTAIFVIRALDLNEAIRIASTMPQTHNGPIEVRPAYQFDQYKAMSSSIEHSTEASLII